MRQGETDIIAALLFSLHLSVIGWFLFGRPRALDPAAFLPEPTARRARYRRWLVRAWCLFGLTALLSLALLGDLALLTGMPRAFQAVTTALGGFIGTGELVEGVLIGSVTGVGVLAALFAIQRWRRRGPPGMIGNVAALMPRSRGELPYGLLLALSAGITEEIFFRLSLPLTIMLVGGSAWLAIGIATLLFGAVHRYQGWRGMVATALVGALFAALYAVSGALWLVMLAHALMDVVALVVRPIFAGAWRVR